MSERARVALADRAAADLPGRMALALAALSGSAPPAAGRHLGLALGRPLGDGFRRATGAAGAAR